MFVVRLTCVGCVGGGDVCGVCVCVCGWVRELVCIVVLQLCRYIYSHIIFLFWHKKCHKHSYYSTISIYTTACTHVTSYLILVYVESGAIYARMCVYTGVKGYCTTLGCLL